MWHGHREQLADHLQRSGEIARTVTTKVRYSDFTTITRSHTAPPDRDADAIAHRAVALLSKTEAGERPVRLLGASVHNLIDPEEIEPEDDEEPRLPFEEFERQMRSLSTSTGLPPGLRSSSARRITVLASANASAASTSDSVPLEYTRALTVARSPLITAGA